MVQAAGRPQEPIFLDLQVPSGTESAESLRKELEAALCEEMKDWKLRPAEGRPPADAPVLRVRVTSFKQRPPASPFLTMGGPGLLGLGSGAAVISSSTGPGSGIVIGLVGLPLLGAGVAFVVLGSVFGGKQVHLDHQRGYPLHTLTVKVAFVRMVEGSEETWKERYRSSDLAETAQPLGTDLPPTVEQVRQEMIRVLAHRLRLDLAKECEWIPEPEP